MQKGAERALSFSAPGRLSQPAEEPTWLGRKTSRIGESLHVWPLWGLIAHLLSAWSIGEIKGTHPAVDDPSCAWAEILTSSTHEPVVAYNTFAEKKGNEERITD